MMETKNMDIDLEAECARLEVLIAEQDKILREIGQELTKQGAPAGQSLPQRVRDLGKSLRIEAEAAKEITVDTIAHAEEAVAKLTTPKRRKPDRSRGGITHHFCIGGHDGYFTVNFFDDGSPGEIFVKIAKMGSTTSGFLDTLARFISRDLQHGDPLIAVCYSLVGQSFEPRGATPNADIPFAESIVDYLGRWLQQKYIAADEWTTYIGKKQAKKRRLALLDDVHAGAE